jgi:dienelactone hydrolase
MDTLQFLLYRVAFTGLPFGELQGIVNRVEAGEPWKESCQLAARRLRCLAEDAETTGRLMTASQAWRWTACAYHAATFAFHLNPEANGRVPQILKLRRMARIAYIKALHADSFVAQQVEIPIGSGFIQGYLRTPAATGVPVVVLLNGLDSLCEVEMHTFGSWLLSRNLAVLSLDLPACFAARPRTPMYNVEEIAPAIADWLAEQPNLADSAFGAFGVSFGGHLVARMLAGDPRFRAGVAVSPAAWMGPRELESKRVRLMFACAFDLHKETDIDSVASGIRLNQLPPPAGRLLVFQMDQDHLFGPEHVEAFREWGNGSVEVRSLSAEHVGTSQFHRWLPDACDWLSQYLCIQKGEHLC